MVTLTVRPYSGETDLQPIADLLNLCETVDRDDAYHTAAGLQLELTDPTCDPSRDVRLWHNANGQLIAFGQIGLPSKFVDSINGYLWFRVHPNERNQGLEREIIAWGEARLRDVAQERAAQERTTQERVTQGNQLPAVLRVTCRDSQPDRIALYETSGFVYERCFFRMGRSLTEPIPQPQLPAGFMVKSGQETNSNEWVNLYNQTFIDHWNFHPTTVEQAAHWLSDPNYRPEFDLVAVDANGTYAAFCFAHIDVEENQNRGCREGWINMLGTRRGFRRLGLGRAMLLTGLHRLQQAGMETAFLGVDAQNPNQAYALYESVGFRKVRTNLFYNKRLS